MTPASQTVTRFAPSPTGFLHLGHVYSALFAAGLGDAKNGGRFLLRIEDIDAARARPEFEAAIIEDLAWLGLTWDGPVRRQSDHMDDYRAALDELQSQGLLYSCFCTRKEIRAEIEESGFAPHDIPQSPDGPVYPGTCRAMTDDERRQRRAEGTPFALRLDMEAAIKAVGSLAWTDADQGETAARPEIFGDVVLARKDTPASYHLAVSVDDHLQGVTLVTRGEDLFAATHVHRLLQALLRLDTPSYHHHKLLTADGGERFAKRDKSETIRALREAGKTSAEVREMAGMAP
ncbi:MAG: tRNA glutamyl-Q(34) synthetase GluQRS [Rhodospirillaceae bacterium]|jgi:glutamyl-Q tRNA(Asp) synthetase|nr:tRNA glutamyl-Q(34) synthetase GluQRS [Rhodospirillaceae bacterium]|tara:strand:- start:2336 stop:3205 length:870 start_codon:yes stop_codon:yes gene_type:complete